MVDWKKDIKLSDLLAREKDESQQADVETEAHVGTDEPEPEKRPFFKRELSFGRRSDEADDHPGEHTADEPVAEPVAESGFDTPADEPERRPFFKREIRFRRDKPTDDADLVSEPNAEARTPFWKRELSFRRRDEALEETAAESFDAEEEKRPFFKRDLRFGRRRPDGFDGEQPRDEPAGEDHPVAAVMPTDGEEQGKPFWKRDLSFGRRKDASTDDGEFETVQAEDAEEQPFFKRELRFGRRATEVSDAEQPAEQPEDTADGKAPADDAAGKPFWKRELRFARRETDVSEANDQSEPLKDGVDHQAEATDAKPFWKRELSFGRRKEASAEFGTEREGDDEGPAGRPFFKRELRFGRRQRDVADPEFETVAQAVEDAPAPVAGEQDSSERQREHGDNEVEEQKRFSNRKLGFRAKKTGLDVEREEGQPEKQSFLKRGFRARSQESDFETPESQSRPFWKRELGFGRSKDDDFDVAAAKPEKRAFFSRGFGRRKGENPAESDFEVPEEKRPFWKRELSLRGKKRDVPQAVTTTRAAKGGRKKQFVGLKVGASQIAAAHVVNNGAPELTQVARMPIEQGIVVGGELRDPDALAEALREFFAGNKLPNRNVRLGIGNNRIGVRTFEISGVHDPKQLENAIRFRAQEALPIPLDEAVLDYHVIDETVSPTGMRSYRVLLVVAYRELVDRYVAACRNAGLRLVGIDLEAFALLRAMSPPPSEGFPEDSALVAVAIGHDRSTFAVSNGAVCEFTRVLDWGGSSLNTAIARALDMTPSQAEPVKRTLTLSGGEKGTEEPVNEHTARAEEAVRLELQSFARELVSSLHFYQNQPGSLAIGSIALTGGTAHLPGLAAELQRLIGVKVRVGDPLRRVKTSKRVDAPDQLGSLAVAIGLGIED